MGNVDSRPYGLAVLEHAIAKSNALGIMLSCETRLEHELASVGAATGSTCVRRDRLVLRPSNGVLEASDYLSPKHDWVQLSQEVTEPLFRALYIPKGLKRMTCL